jgi:hypothetical protein
MPPPLPFSVRVVGGGGVTDSIDAQLIALLVAEARDDDGRPRPGIPIRFSLIENDAGAAGPPLRLLPTPSSPGETTVILDTDAEGRASTRVVFGRRVGIFRVAVGAVDAARGDTATFTVTPGAVARIEVSGPRDTLVSVGRGYTPAAAAYDRLGNEIADAIRLATESAACRIETQRIVGASVGRCIVVIRAASLADTIRLTSVPVAKLLAVVEGPTSYTDQRLASFGFDGSEYRELTPLTYQFTKDPWLPTRAPDGVRITMHAGMGQYSSHITIFDSSGSPRVFRPAGINSLYENWGRFSGDGAWLYFSARTDAAEAFSVWRARADGSGAERLTPSAPNLGAHSNYADVTPDRRFLVYADGQLRLTVMDLATRAVRTLTAEGQPLQSYALRISPDGARIAYVYDWPNRFGLRIINLDGSGYRLLSTDVGYTTDEVPVDWTPDGEWILNRRYRAQNVGGGTTLIHREDWVLVNAMTAEIITLPYKVKPINITVQR